MLRDVEVFDPAANDWYRLPALPTGRHGVNVAAFNGKLFVIGGHTRSSRAAAATRSIRQLNEVFEFAGAGRYKLGEITSHGGTKARRENGFSPCLRVSVAYESAFSGGRLRSPSTKRHRSIRFTSRSRKSRRRATGT